MYVFVYYNIVDTGFWSITRKTVHSVTNFFERAKLLGSVKVHTNIHISLNKTPFNITLHLETMSV